MKIYKLFNIYTNKVNVYIDVKDLCADLWGTHLYDYVLIILLERKSVVFDWKLSDGELGNLEVLLNAVK